MCYAAFLRRSVWATYVCIDRVVDTIEACVLVRWYRQNIVNTFVMATSVNTNAVCREV
jgi:hypothetical protein